VLNKCRKIEDRGKERVQSPRVKLWLRISHTLLASVIPILKLPSP
jgi:hypothetical protein